MVPIVMVKEPGPLPAEVAGWVRGTGMPLVLHESEREALNEQPERNRCLNIARARTEAFRKACGEYPGAEYFFSLDADVVPPAGALARLAGNMDLMRMACPLSWGALGGWFPAKRGGVWTGGRYVADHEFRHFPAPQAGFCETDLLSLGCTLVRRKLVEGHVFDAGIDRVVRNGAGEWCQLADSGAFSNRLNAMGVRMFLDGGVIARHLCVQEI